MKMMKRFMAMMMVIALVLSLSTAFASMVRTTASVNIRNGAGLNYSSRGTASKDTMFVYQGESRVDDRGTEWFKVEHGVCEYGWISSKYSYLVTDPAAMPTDTVTAVTGKTYIRDGAGLQAEVKGTLQQGATATYLGDSTYDDRNVEWYYVRSQGIYGWVSSKYTVFGSGDYQPEPVATRYVVTSGDAQTNIRETPSLSGKALKILHKDETAVYLEDTRYDDRNVAWYKVRFGNTVGWVSSKYTVITKSPSKPAPKAKSTVVTTDGLQTNVRNTPNRSGKVLKVLHKDEVATYLDKVEYDERGVAWYRVSFDGVTGWVSSKYTVIK